MTRVFRADACDLCGARGAESLLHLVTKRALRSDRAILDSDLTKLQCDRCGLVRCGTTLTPERLSDFYRDQYTLSIQPEHIFYASTGPVSRSQAICDWIVTETGDDPWLRASRVLEVGAGSGALLAQFRERFPDSAFEGFELSQQAVAVARGRGLEMHSDALDVLPRATYDLVYAVGVIEHVPSPKAFLDDLWTRLRPGGQLILCQPTQDTPSYDVFFVDHLHHFGTAHLRGYAHQCGFDELTASVGHPLMPNFSTHVWRKTSRPAQYDWTGEPASTTCQSTISRVSSDLARLDASLSELRTAGRKVAVFGLNEVYWLARAYSELGSCEIVCGLDDRPDNPAHRQLEFPVVVPEESVRLGVDHVLLLMNKIYYERASARMRDLGLSVSSFLS